MRLEQSLPLDFLDLFGMKKLAKFRICIREYQDLEFFPDQLQTFIERCIGPHRFQM